jgi:hypothetical protein
LESTPRKKANLEVTTDMSDEFAQFSTTGTLDAEYRFGQPKVYLAPHELARLTILRSRLGDTHADRLARAAGSQAPSPLSPASPRSLR